jgi:hypothetical protein
VASVVSLDAVPPTAVIPLPTVEAAMVGRFSRGPLQGPVAVGSEEFVAMFGSAHPGDWPAEVQARQFFANGGARLHVVRVDPSGPLETALTGDSEAMTGLGALVLVRDLRLVLIPELSRLSADAGSSSSRAGSFFCSIRLPGCPAPPPRPPGWTRTSQRTPASARFITLTCK